MFRHLISHIQLIFILCKSQIFILVLYIGIGIIPLNLNANQTDWILSGTFLNNDQAHAMFVDQYGAEMVLTSGEKINGCKLFNILKGSAELNCGDKIHTIHLRNSVGEVAYPDTQYQGTKKYNFITLSKKSVLKYIDKRQKLISEISLVPYMDNQKVVGFIVSRIQPFTKVAELGLYNGDIITSVNGVSAKQPSEFLQTVRELRAASEVTVEIDRFGRELSYRYILN